MRKLPEGFNHLIEYGEEVLEVARGRRIFHSDAEKYAECGFVASLSWPFGVISFFLLLALYIMTGGPTSETVFLWTAVLCLGFFALSQFVRLFDKTKKNADDFVERMNHETRTDPRYWSAELIAEAVYSFSRLVKMYSKVADAPEGGFDAIDVAGANRLYELTTEVYPILARAIDYYIMRKESIFEQSSDYHKSLARDTYIANEDVVRECLRRSEAVLSCPSLRKIGELAIV